MSECQSVGAVRRGFVRGVVSSRLGGVAFPADLVRVAAGIARRDGARRRVASAFAGYLVTDAGPGVVPMFSQHRAAHEYGILPECVTGAAGVGFFGSNWGKAGGPIDAPSLMPSGAMRSTNFGGVSGVVHRWSESRRGVGLPLIVAEDGAGPDAGKVRRDDAGRVLVLLATEPLCYGLRGALLDAAQVGALDAPEFLPGGSVQRAVNCVGFVAVQRLALRGGWSL